MTKITLLVDPGLRACGVALFRNKELLKAGLPKSPNKTDRGPYAWRAMAAAVSCWVDESHFRCEFSDIDVLVVETQQVYAARYQKGDQDDLLQLAGVNGAISYVFQTPEAYSVLPREWKGTVKKEVMTARILSKLSPKDLSQIDDVAASLRHNVVDAIGLGIWFLGRGGRS